MTYGPGDLLILDDPIKIIRSNPTLYGGKHPRGGRLAAAIANDLIYDGDVPVGVSRIDKWWLITCEKDWLSDNAADRSEYWFRMIPTPEFAPDSIRAEVLLTAFSKGLVTLAQGRLQHIVEEWETPGEVKDHLNRMIEAKFSGRAVAFIAD